MTDQPAGEPKTFGAIIEAAKNADWMQVVLNQGPPCFHYEPERRLFCLRAERWAGHGDFHAFVPLADLLSRELSEARALQGKLEHHWRCFHCNAVFTEEAEAKEHFGADEYEVEHPACVDPLRTDEKERMRVVSEMRKEIQRVEHERDEFEIGFDNFYTQCEELERLFGDGVTTAHHAWLRLEAAQNLAEAYKGKLEKARELLRQSGFYVAASLTESFLSRNTADNEAAQKLCADIRRFLDE
jgi:hypothetical protein